MTISGSAASALSLPDAAWLGLDSPRNPMVITAVLRFDERIERERFRALLETRLLAQYPSFTRRPVRGRLRRPAWRVDPAFALDRHLDYTALPAPGGDAALRMLVGSLLPEPLDLRHSPWRFVLVDGYGDGAALVARLHHCLADGIALASVLLSLAEAGDNAEPAAGKPRQRGPRPVRVGTAVVRTGLRVLAFRRSPPGLRGRAGAPNRVAWTAPLELTDIKAVAAGVGATVNDVLLAVVAGALRRWLLEVGDPAVDIRVLVPVNLRTRRAEAELGNRFGVVFVRLPLGVPDGVERVRALAAETRRLRSSAEPVATYLLLGAVGVLPAPLQRQAVRLLGAKSTAVVTNVPGPQQPVTVSGSRLSSVVFWAPRPGGTALSVSIFSYAGAVTVGIAADSDPAGLIDGVTAELADLRARIGPGR